MVAQQSTHSMLLKQSSPAGQLPQSSLWVVQPSNALILPQMALFIWQTCVSVSGEHESPPLLLLPPELELLELLLELPPLLPLEELPLLELPPLELPPLELPPLELPPLELLPLELLAPLLLALPPLLPFEPLPLLLPPDPLELLLVVPSWRASSVASVAPPSSPLPGPRPPPSKPHAATAARTRGPTRRRMHDMMPPSRTAAINQSFCPLPQARPGHEWWRGCRGAARRPRCPRWREPSSAAPVWPKLEAFSCFTSFFYFFLDAS
jgi:hypothetical protein